jgi:hypothetical protein
MDLQHSIHLNTKTLVLTLMHEKEARVCMAMIHFCCYQLTVVANHLLLTADKSVRTFSMPSPKFIIIK